MARRFGQKAEAYAASPRFAAGADLQILVALLEPAPHMVVLDVATGAGHTAAAVAPHVRRVVAIDLASEMIEQTRALTAARGLANLAAQVMDVEALAFPDATFDAVTCRIAPHHFTDVRHAVSEIARVLRAGGRFILEDSLAPDEPDLARFLHDLEQLRDPTHVRSYTRGEWEEMLSAAGLRVDHAEPYPHTLDVNEWLNRSALSPAARAQVEAAMVNAPPEARERFAMRFKAGHPVTYLDTKLILRAIKTPEH